LGFACLHQNKIEKAIGYFQKHLALVPDSPISELVNKLSAGERGTSTVYYPGTDGPQQSNAKCPWWKFW